MESNGEDALPPPYAVSASASASAWDPHSDTPGKHRLAVHLNRLQQEARFLHEELEEVQKTETVSAGLQELVYKIDSLPDPLLPITTGPASEMWDQWFERPKQMRRCRCWII